MNLWKPNIKTTHDKGENPKQFCLDHKIMGVGWPVQGVPGQPSGNQYLSAARTRLAVGGKKMPGALNAIVNRVKGNDLVWLRDDANHYYLGRVIGGWNYVSYDGKDDDWDKNDIHNYREMEWQGIGTADEIPWGIRKQFSRGTLNSINADGPAMLAFSKRAWNQTASAHSYEVTKTEEGQGSIFSFIGPDACEDIVALYLQAEKEYFLIPSTCKQTTKHYEFVLRHPDGHRAYVQVKNGGEELRGTKYRSTLTKPDDKFCLFTLGACNDDGLEGVECLDPELVEAWMLSKDKIWSEELSRWA
jgi:hypothetical protein